MFKKVSCSSTNVLFFTPFCFLKQFSWKTQLQKIQGEPVNNANVEKRQSIDRKIHFSSHASILRQGYMPEWKYTLQCKRLLDANKEKIAQKAV